MVTDRFEKISHDYYAMLCEVFAEQCQDYVEFEHSVLQAVEKVLPTYREAKILDVGCGEGATLRPFYENKCKYLTGIDVNREMLDNARTHFDETVVLTYCDATNMNQFQKEDVDVLLSGACVHNIASKDRPLFFSEVVRLQPKVIVLAEKIADKNKYVHKQYYDREVAALEKVFGERHNLPKIAKEWVEHYEYDEREKMYLKEIEDALKDMYDLSITLEMGMFKTVVGTLKK